MAVPSNYVCPFTEKVMIEPVRGNGCSHRFERTVACLAEAKGALCPLDHKPIQQIEGDDHLALGIREYILAHPEVFHHKTPEELFQNRCKMFFIAVKDLWFFPEDEALLEDPATTCIRHEQFQLAVGPTAGLEMQGFVKDPVHPDAQTKKSVFVSNDLKSIHVRYIDPRF